MPLPTRLHLLLAALFVLASLWPAASAADRAKCEIDKLELCANMNELVGKPKFKGALSDFIGDRPAGWLYEDGTMLNQAFSVLGGPPDQPIRFSDNLIRFSACRYHSCPEKGAVILTDSGEIKAVGVIHFDVSRSFKNNLSLNPMLTILIRHKGKRFQTIADHLFAWYVSVIDDNNQYIMKIYNLPDESDELQKPKEPEIILLRD